MLTDLIPVDYAALKDEVIQLLEEGKTRIERVIVEETLRTYHEIGRILDTYLLVNKNRGTYGEQTVVRLAGDVGISKSALYQAQKVRLRGIDAPELPTSEGRRAKDFVVQALSKAPFVVVTTTKPDKYDRYLADVFFGDETDDAETVLRNGTFLNRALVVGGLAKRFREGGG